LNLRLGSQTRRKLVVNTIQTPFSLASSLGQVGTCEASLRDRMNFLEAIVTKNYASADVLTKAMYFFLAAGVLLFISMLLLTLLHP
jgi:hypothetical protein